MSLNLGYEYPSQGALRKMAFESESNDLKDAFLKVGRRRLVLPETLFRLLKEKGAKQTDHCQPPSK